MATSSERSPPPFPESEDQDQEPEEGRDSDDGEDMFIGTIPAAEAKMEAPLPPSVVTNTLPSDLFSDPPEDGIGDPLSDGVGRPPADPARAHPENAPIIDFGTEPRGGLIFAANDIVEKALAGAGPGPTGGALLNFGEPVSEPFSEPLEDIFGDPLSDPTGTLPRTFEEPPLVDVLRKPATEPVTAGTGDAVQEPPKVAAPDEALAKGRDLQDVGPRKASAEVGGGERCGDIFEEPQRHAHGRPPKDALFGDDPDDNDLFGEPLGAVKEVPGNALLEAKGARAGEPVRAPTDLFSEEGLSPANVHANPKTNGVHSDDDEQDIFAEATVELSLDSPRNNRKEDVARPPAAVPIVSVAPPTASVQSKMLEELEEEEEKEEKFDLNIAVTNPEKVGDGMNAYMAYKVSTRTTMPMFRGRSFTVRRRFSDFLGLFEKLSAKHTLNGYIVPPPPEKSLLGMTKVKVGKEDPSSADFTERRRAALERYLQRVVAHPSLLQDPDVREFLEREELPRAVSTQALSGAGFLKMLNKASDAVSKMTIKMNESDVWFEEKLQEVESEDQQLRKLHAVVESLVLHRKELSANTAAFAKSVAMLGSSEDHTALSRALSQLAEVEDKIEQLHQDQAASDFFILAELLADYVRLLGAVRASFDQRMKTWQRWQDAQSTLQKKRENEAKLLWANKPDKLQQAKEEITEWEAKVAQYERDFDRVSATVRKEVLRFEKEKARDFKKQIIKYLESLQHSQQQLIKYWEAFLPEAKAIA